MIDGMIHPLMLRETAMATGREVDSVASTMGEDEFRSFYERTARPLWAYLSRVTGDRSKADDLLQETYYRFCRAAAQYENEEHRRNSLFRIATNLARDAARRSRGRDEVPLERDDSSGIEIASGVPVPEQEVAVRTDLARAINRLEPLQRELLWLAYAQGASHEEIAAITGLRAISIRTLLLRARRKLASFMTRQEVAR